jgi:molybdopterin adenylyltransferase
MPIRVAALTVSDRGADGEREDRSGDTIASWVAHHGYVMAARQVVPDESDRIALTLARWADDDVADVILTTGGTGLTARDVTPEATEAVIERAVPGIAEAMRADGRASTPWSLLARGVAGTRGRALMVNLPGSEGGVRDGLAVLAPLLEHAVQLMTDDETEHG